MLAAALLTLAQATAPAPEPTNQARVENFMLVQLWTDDPDKFLAAWNQPSPPRLNINTKVERNQLITAFVIFSGCKADTTGNCNLTGDIEFRDPDGEIYGESKDIDFWSGPAIEGFNLRLSPIGPSLVIEDGEKLGKYTVRITVTDNNANVTAVTEEELTIVEAE